MALVEMRRNVLRRVPIALLIAAFVSVGIGAAVASGSSDPDDAAPVSMVVPGPREGDRGTYEVTLAGPWSSDADAFNGPPDWQEPWTAYSFTWNSREMQTGTGAPARLAVVDIDVTGWYPFGFGDGWQLATLGASYGYHDGEMVVAKGVTGFDSTGGVTYEDPALGTFGPFLATTSSLSMEVERFDGLTTNCVFGHALAGRVLLAGAQERLDAPCFMGALSLDYTPAARLLDENETIRVVGPAELGGIPAMRVRIGESVEAWYAPDFPVPLQYIVSEGDGRTATFVLSGFEHGVGGIAEGPLPPRPSPPLTAPLRPWGVAGMETLPFPADDAYARLQDHAQVGPFIESGAVLVNSLYYEWERSDGTIAREWYMRLASDDASQVVFITQQVPTGSEGLPDAVIAAVAQYDIKVVPLDEGVDISWAPTSAPTLEGAAAGWHRQGGEGAVDTAGFSYCRPCAGGIAVTAGASVARLISQEQDPMDPATNQEAHVDYATIDGDGLVIQRLRSDYSFDAVPGAETVEPADESEPLTAVSSDARLITPGQVAAVGFFGLFAGALYAFWPALKAGPVALFSRLRKPELLEHPTRQTIVDAVTAQPGIHLNDLRRLTGLANGTMRHHVDHLVRNDILTKRTNAGYTCLFLKATDRRELDVAPLLRSEGARTVLDAVKANPGATGKEIAQITGLAAGTVGYHVRRLGDVGAITARRQGRRVALTAA